MGLALRLDHVGERRQHRVKRSARRPLTPLLHPKNDGSLETRTPQLGVAASMAFADPAVKVVECYFLSSNGAEHMISKIAIAALAASLAMCLPASAAPISLTDGGGEVIVSFSAQTPGYQFQISFCGWHPVLP